MPLPPSFDALRALALRAAAAGAAVHAQWRGRALEVHAKSAPSDVVTQVDREAERAIIDVILAVRPDDGLLAEEGSAATGTSGVRWIIDPLDGTTNYVYGWPAYGVAIGVEWDGRDVVGVVHDSAIGRVYAGQVDGAATCDGRVLRARDGAALSMALVATGFQAAAAHRACQASTAAALLPHIRDLRRGGSAAIDIASVAAGTLDAYYELGLSPWDTSGGCVIAAAAGAAVRVTPVTNARGPMVVVAGPRLIDPLTDALRAAGAFDPLPPLAAAS